VDTFRPSDHGFAQIQLSDNRGSDQGDIGRTDCGPGAPNEKALIRIADALGADLKSVACARCQAEGSKRRAEITATITARRQILAKAPEPP
jgi:hypothetical protein